MSSTLDEDFIGFRYGDQDLAGCKRLPEAQVKVVDCLPSDPRDSPRCVSFTRGVGETLSFIYFRHSGLAVLLLNRLACTCWIHLALELNLLSLTFCALCVVP